MATLSKVKLRVMSERSKIILVSLTSFLFGVLLIYFLNLNWIRTKQDLMNKIIVNMKDAFELQDQLRVKSDNTLKYVSDCLFEGKNCTTDDIRNKISDYLEERDKLTSKLINTNNESEKVMIDLMETDTYSDAGKQCNNSSECYSRKCIIPAGSDNQNTKQGKCSSTTHPEGCFKEVKNGIVSNTICLD